MFLTFAYKKCWIHVSTYKTNETYRVQDMNNRVYKVKTLLGAKRLATKISKEF